MKRTISAVLATTALLLTVGCGDDEGSESSESTAAAGGITISGQWARNSAMVGGTGAAYFTVTAAEDDAIVGASVSADVAGKVELHETKMNESGDMGSETTMAMDEKSTDDGSMGDGSMDDGHMDGEMTMVPVERIELPAGKAVSLKPGGIHIMLIDLTAPLETGTEIDLTLDFENAEDLTIKVPVQEEAP